MELTLQTTDDILNEEIVEELLKRRVDRINVSGLDSWHEGLEAEAARESLQEADSPVRGPRNEAPCADRYAKPIPISGCGG